MNKAKRAIDAPAVTQRTPDDLFATIYQQAQNVLAKVCGFYVVTYDDERELVRLVYFVDRGKVREPGATYDVKLCNAVCEGRPIINCDFTHQIADGVVSSICVPMSRNGVVLGAFAAYARTDHVYDARDAKALLAIAEIGAIALENMRFVIEIEKSRREAVRVEEIGRAISASLETTEVLRRVVEAAVDLLGADSATVWLMRGDDEVEAAMSAGEVAAPVGTVLRVPRALRRRLLEKEGRPYFVFEEAKDSNELSSEMREVAQTQSRLAVALIAHEEVLGALSIGHKEKKRYSDADIHLLERLSFSASAAVANARLHEQIRALSLTDSLTNMPNRRHLDMFLEREFAAARRGRRLSVLIFDLDHFKEYNDRAGHPSGDLVLRNFGSLLLAHTRAMNLAARYGGDEFVAILADSDQEGAEAHAERIMDEIDKDPYLAAAGVRASIGVATYNPEMTSFHDLIRAADRDLYVRKAARPTYSDR
jgi:diguanylate cyclase (GGDEF)-like protein